MFDGLMKRESGDRDVLDVPGAMDLLRLGRNAVYRLCATNEIPHRRVGKQLRFSRSALLRWLEGDPPKLR